MEPRRVSRCFCLATDGYPVVSDKEWEVQHSLILQTGSNILNQPGGQVGQIDLLSNCLHETRNVQRYLDGSRLLWLQSSPTQSENARVVLLLRDGVFLEGGLQHGKNVCSRLCNFQFLLRAPLRPCKPLTLTSTIQEVT